MNLLFSMAVYFVAISYTLALMIGIPVAIAAYILGARRIGTKLIPIWVTASIYAAYLVGGFVGWMLRPAQWTLSFAQTFDAAGNAAKYGNILEHQAERVLMYPWYMACLFSISVALAMGLLRLLRPRSNV
jgi:hypothetical protein